MAECDFFSIWADWEGLSEAAVIGSVRLIRKRQRRVPEFRFTDSWLSRQDFRMLDPHLELRRDTQAPIAGHGNFGFLTDSAPHRWGRRLLQKHENFRAEREGRQPRRLDDFDLLFAVPDSMRVGALRVRCEDGDAEPGPWISPSAAGDIPTWEELPELQRTASASMLPEDSGAEEDAHRAIILRSGASLGGSRPKATVQDEHGSLWIAKLPSDNDGVHVVLWEYLMHQLAQEAGITVPPARVEELSDGTTTYLVRRFDRTADHRRVHIASAQTLLGRSDTDESPVSYLDLAEIIRKTGSRPREDLKELWSQLAFNVAVSNCDDHLRNHSFLLELNGWHLAPAYDINPDPAGTGLSLDILPGDNRLNFELLHTIAPYFGLSRNGTAQRLDEILGAVSCWRVFARNLGIPRGEMEIMSPAFHW